MPVWDDVCGVITYIKDQRVHVSPSGPSAADCVVRPLKLTWVGPDAPLMDRSMLTSDQIDEPLPETSFEHGFDTLIAQARDQLLSLSEFRYKQSVSAGPRASVAGG